jgi:DNA-binding MarR family transcriptional regulator
MAQAIVQELGNLLTDFLGIIGDADRGLNGHRGIYSVREMRVLYAVISHWRRQSACTVTQIAGETGISKTTVSRCVSNMMEAQLVVELPDPHDGRRRLLQPTERGRQILQNLDDWLTLWAERLLELAREGQATVVVSELRRPSVIRGS